MKITSPGLSVLLGLSAAAAIGIGVVIERGAPPAHPVVKLPAELTASEAELARPDLPPDKQLELMHAVAKTYLRYEDYPNAIIWAQRYLKAGGVESDVRPLLAQAYLRLGDFANAARELQWEIQHADRAGQPPDEDRLLLLQKCYAQLNDGTAYVWVLEKLLTYYPRREYWADLLERTRKRPDISDLQALHVDRLRLLTGTLGGASEYLAMAAQAKQAGFPAEAKRVVDHGIANGALGRGHEGDGHRQLQRQLAHETLVQQRRINRREVELAAEKAKDGIELFDLGFAHVTVGNHDKGLVLMEKGLRKGPLAGRPQYARLHLGIAYLMAGQKDSAIETFKLVGGKHAAPDLARIWAIYARSVG